MSHGLGWDHTWCTSGGAENEPSCLFRLSSQSAGRPSSPRWQLGTTPELGASLQTVQLPELVEFTADPLPPGRADDTSHSGLGPTGPVAAMRMDNDMSWMPILLQPWPKLRAKMHGCTSNVRSEWMARLCKKELKLDLSTSPVL